MIEFEAVVHVSLHPEYPTGKSIRSTKVEDSEFDKLKWMTVKLTNGVNRDVLVKEVKRL